MFASLAFTMFTCATMLIVFCADALKRAPKAPADAPTTIADVTRIARERAHARIVPVACGYLIMRPTVDYTNADRAWFRSPVGGA